MRLYLICLEFNSADNTCATYKGEGSSGWNPEKVKYFKQILNSSINNDADKTTRETL